TLVGTMVANRPEWSFATIKSSDPDARVYLVGDEIEGAEIVDIERLRVILNNQGRKEYISIEGTRPADAPRIAANPPSTTRRSRGDRPEPVDSEVRKVDENTYEISREDVDKQLSN